MASWIAICGVAWVAHILEREASEGGSYVSKDVILVPGALGAIS